MAGDQGGARGWSTSCETTSMGTETRQSYVTFFGGESVFSSFCSFYTRSNKINSVRERRDMQDMVGESLGGSFHSSFLGVFFCLMPLQGGRREGSRRVG